MAGSGPGRLSQSLCADLLERHLIARQGRMAIPQDSPSFVVVRSVTFIARSVRPGGSYWPNPDGVIRVYGNRHHVALRALFARAVHAGLFCPGKPGGFTEI